MKINLAASDRRKMLSASKHFVCSMQMSREPAEFRVFGRFAARNNNHRLKILQD
jgi:hypothetical protein